jgi:hypothetical protein
MDIKNLKSNWKKMTEQIVQPSQVNPIQGNTAQMQQTVKPQDNRKIQQIEALKQKVRDIDTKISPLLDQKRKLEDQIAKLSK